MQTQTLYLLILFIAFIGIVVWAFGRKRKARFERDARIPFEERDKGT
jgi:cytochrome c oxidase cbb3-type subunit 4